MNHVTLLGNLTKNPEIRRTASGLAVTPFTLAINKKDKEADFIPCVAFGRRAEVCSELLKKGMQICIEGHLSSGSYEKNGMTIRRTSVVVDKFFFMKKQKDEEIVSTENKNEMQEKGMEDEGFELLQSDDYPW